MSMFGAFVDFFSASLPADQEGYLLGLSPEQVQHLILQQLQNHYVEVSLKPRKAGYFNYAYSAIIQRSALDTHKTVQAGLIAWTPADLAHDVTNTHNPGVFLSLSGDGCVGVDFSAFIAELLPFSPRITRLDVAVDYYQGEVTFEELKRYYHLGYFASGGPNPRHSLIEPKRSKLDSATEEKTGGFTLYVGKRGGAKFFRGYEKHRQQLDTVETEGELQQRSEDLSDHYDWLRLEVETRNANCEIPLSAVSNLDAYLLGIYPRLFECLPMPQHVQVSPPDEIYPIKLDWHSKRAQVELGHLIFHCRHAYGGLINVLANKLNKPPEDIITSLLPDDLDNVPNRLLLPI